jgi:flagellar protein FliL
MTDEPKKDAKTSAEGAAGGAAAGPATKAPTRGEDVAQEAEEAAGKDEKKGRKKGKEAKQEAAAGGEEKAPRKPFKIPEVAVLAAIVVVALAAGSVLGMLLIAPRVIVARNAAVVAQAHAGKTHEEGEKGEGKGKKGEGEKSAIYSIENIIVNPAGSAGSRFLMASVAFELADEKEVEELRGKEVQVRDAVITTLEGQSLDMLSAPGAREGIKRRIAAAVKPLVPGRRPPRVYLPQFVLQ